MTKKQKGLKTKVKKKPSYRGLYRRSKITKTFLFGLTTFQLSAFLALAGIGLATATLHVYNMHTNQTQNTTRKITNQVKDSDQAKDTNSSSNDQDSKEQANRRAGGINSQNQPDCKTEVIPYETTYQDVTHLIKGQKEVVGGQDGSIKDCGDGNPTIVKPKHKTVYIGTGLTEEEIRQQHMTEYEREYARWLTNRNQVYQNCMNNFSSYYPYKEAFCQNQALQQVGPPPQQP